MKKWILDYIICPNCKSESLFITPLSETPSGINEGVVTCKRCNSWYKIEDGILDLLPLGLRRHDLYMQFAKKHRIAYQHSNAQQTGYTQKNEQISFFKKDVAVYDKEVINTPYFKSLNKCTFENWFDNNHWKVRTPLLEIGCGTGNQTVYLARHNKTAVCIDISEEMIRQAKSKIDKLQPSCAVYFIVGDAEDPPVKNNAFGACVICSTLHHLTSPETALRNISKKLINRGLFYSLDPNDSYVRFIFDCLMRVWRLHDEKAGLHPTINEKDLKAWLTAAKIRNTVKYSTYLPPHTFLFLNDRLSTLLLKHSDAIFNFIPGLYKFSGVITAEGIKVD